MMGMTGELKSPIRSFQAQCLRETSLSSQYGRRLLFGKTPRRPPLASPPVMGGKKLVRGPCEVANNEPQHPHQLIGLDP
jgi:hypothetical protein